MKFIIIPICVYKIMLVLFVQNLAFAD